MSNLSDKNYFFLNREGSWPHFQWSGLELQKDGSLQLCSVPVLTTTLPDAVKNAPTPDGPAGMAVDGTGTVYFSDPGGNCVRRILGCDGDIVSVPCMGGTG